MKLSVATFRSQSYRRECLVCPNRQTRQKAKAYMVADAHLDTQWNWDIQTTIKRVCLNTLSQNLFLLKRYPDYVFNFEGGVKYAWMKEYYPAQYEEMKEYIRNGRWHISGSSWDATDVLVPSTESFIRNILLGQEYYRKEFGVETRISSCQIVLVLADIADDRCPLRSDRLLLQKLDWRNHPFYGKSKHPFMIGLWKGVDGASIMLAHGYDYGRRWKDEDLSEVTICWNSANVIPSISSIVIMEQEIRAVHQISPLSVLLKRY